MAPETSIKTEKSQKVKSEKKHKSKSKEDKKRKRDTGDDTEKKHKSKKHRKSDGKAVISGQPSAPISPFHTQTASLYLSLSPISQKQPLEGFCAEHLSPLLLTYYPPLNGVVLSYSNPRISERPFEHDGPETLLKCIDEYAVSFAWVTADFLVFKPERGGELEGYINLQNEGHLGLVCWNLFNASIERARLPKEWKWISAGNEEAGEGNYAEEGIGYYVDENGDKIEGTLKFRVKDIESSHDRERGFLSIEGTMLGAEEEAELLGKDNSTGRLRHVLGSGSVKYGAKALGATSLGVPREINEELDTVVGKKHRQTYS